MLANRVSAVLLLAICCAGPAEADVIVPPAAALAKLHSYTPPAIYADVTSVDTLYFDAPKDLTALAAALTPAKTMAEVETILRSKRIAFKRMRLPANKAPLHLLPPMVAALPPGEPFVAKFKAGEQATIYALNRETAR